MNDILTLKESINTYKYYSWYVKTYQLESITIYN